MSEELKPCPFCGGKFVSLNIYHNAGTDYFSYSCDECDGESSKRVSKCKAEISWNKRIN